MKFIRAWFLLPALLVVVVLVVLAGCGSGTSGTITTAGSTTVQPLAEKLALAFKQDNPDVEVTIGGGGSSVGVTACNDGTVDIGAISRELKADEPQLVRHLLAKDGIAIVTSPGNPITGLTRAQVREIFGGTITNWSEVGGPNHSITVVAREEGSGTRAAFEEMVMDKPEPALEIVDSAILLPSNGAVKTAVAGDSYAIGFISFGYIDGTVKAAAIDGVAATEENAKDGSYPIVRPLYFLTKEQPAGFVKDFIDYCLSSEGQAIVSDEGYISID
jgi:phosphate transport system substrate-binding protein